MPVLGKKWLTDASGRLQAQEFLRAEALNAFGCLPGAAERLFKKLVPLAMQGVPVRHHGRHEHPSL